MDKKYLIKNPPAPSPQTTLGPPPSFSSSLPLYAREGGSESWQGERQIFVACYLKEQPETRQGPEEREVGGEMLNRTEGNMAYWLISACPKFASLSRHQGREHSWWCLASVAVPLDSRFCVQLVGTGSPHSLWRQVQSTAL